MKKVSLCLLGLAMLLILQTGSVYASTPLDDAVNDLLGIRYTYGGSTEKGFDCSGFTMFLFAKIGIELPHSSKSQASEGVKVSKDNLRPGDLVFFETDGSGISHVGIYLGNNTFAHAASGGKDSGITKSKLSEDYYAKRYVTARRILSDDLYDKITAESK